MITDASAPTSVDVGSASSTPGSKVVVGSPIGTVVVGMVSLEVVGTVTSMVAITVLDGNGSAAFGSAAGDTGSSSTGSSALSGPIAGNIAAKPAVAATVIAHRAWRAGCDLSVMSGRRKRLKRRCCGAATELTSGRAGEVFGAGSATRVDPSVGAGNWAGTMG